MRLRLLTVSLVLIGLIAGALVLWRIFTPRLLEVSPAPGTIQAPTRSQLRLTFSLPLDTPVNGICRFDMASW